MRAARSLSRLLPLVAAVVACGLLGCPDAAPPRPEAGTGPGDVGAVRSEQADVIGPRPVALGQSGENAARVYPAGMSDVRIDVSALEHEDPATEARYRKLRSLLLAATDDPAWTHRPPEVHGNFVSEYWTRGPHSERVTGGLGSYFTDRPGASWFALDTLTRDLPRVFGLSVQAGRNPPSADAGPGATPGGEAADAWGVRLYVAEKGGGILGSGAEVTFTRWSGGAPKEHLGLVTYVWRIPGQFEPEYLRLEIADPDDELARILRSPDHLAKVARTRYRQLLTRVEQALAAGEVQRVEHGPYLGEGIPPEQTLFPLTPEEVEALQSQARVEIEGWRETIGARKDALHGLLVDLAPWDEVWRLPQGPGAAGPR